MTLTSFMRIYKLLIFNDIVIYYMFFGKEYMSYFISHNITLQKIWHNVTKRKQNRQNGMGKSLTTVAN